MSGNYKRSEDESAAERNRRFAKASQLASRDLKKSYPEEYERFFRNRKAELGIGTPLPMGPRRYEYPPPTEPQGEEADGEPEMDRGLTEPVPDHGDRQ